MTKGRLDNFCDEVGIIKFSFREETMVKDEYRKNLQKVLKELREIEELRE